MNRRSLLFGFAALALAGCATTTVVAPGAGPAELEPIYGVRADRGGLTVRVASNGCTAKADFAFFVERKGGATTVAFARKRLDRCRAFVASGAELAFSYEELGLTGREPVFVLNPLVSGPAL